MNKKSKLISIFFLASLLFISSINVGKAAPPSWVGVDVGDSFTWSISVNRDTAITLATDLGFGDNITDLSITDLFDAQQEVQIKVSILSITDLMTINGTEYVNVTGSVSLILPGTTSIADIAEFGNLIIKYAPNNYTQQLFNIIGGVVTGGTFGALFVPTDINWAQLIAEVNSILSSIPSIPSGLTFTALANGVEATLTGQTINITSIGNVTLATIGVSITYNTDGVLDTAEISYGGDALLTVALTAGADGEIPSYEVSIVLITTFAASIGIIYYIKKKKRLGLET